ncbi:MAG TPA: hypothetical protein VGR57_18805, partial [Ktedonobacterales bacterium]|nr:hypothetical protein [Ktedonobacterales bacterium]
GALGKLHGMSAPQPAFQALLADCTSAVEQAQAFLNTENISAGAPFTAPVSGITVLSSADALLATNPDQVGAASAAVFAVYDAEMQQTSDLRNRLQTEAGQLQTALLTP